MIIIYFRNLDSIEFMLKILHTEIFTVRNERIGVSSIDYDLWKAMEINSLSQRSKSIFSIEKIKLTHGSALQGLSTTIGWLGL